MTILDCKMFTIHNINKKKVLRLMEKISVIIPTFNRQEMLERTLIGFSLQDYTDFEVVVVDDGGTDNSRQVVEKYTQKLNMNYYYQNNKGRAAARNAGLEISQGDYIIFNDDDRIPGKDFIRRHIAELKQNRKRVTIGSKYDIFSNFKYHTSLRKFDVMDFLIKKPSRFEKIKVAKEGNLFTVEELLNDFDNVLEQWVVGRCRDSYMDVISRWGDEMKDFKLPFLVATTANMGFCKVEFPNTRYDQNYIGWGMEDTDFAYQLYHMGCEFKYVDNAQNYHMLHERSDSLMEQLYKNIAYFCKKYDNINTYMFSLIFRDIIDINNASEILDELEKNRDSLLSESYIRLCKYIAESDEI